MMINKRKRLTDIVIMESLVMFHGTPVIEGQAIPAQRATGRLDVCWNAHPEQLYTIVLSRILDPSQPQSQQQHVSHFVVVDIPGVDVRQGRVLVPYQVPRVIPATAWGTEYRLAVYVQSKLIGNGRSVSFDVETYVQQHLLQLAERLQFLILHTPRAVKKKPPPPQPKSISTNIPTSTTIEIPRFVFPCPSTTTTSTVQRPPPPPPRKVKPIALKKTMVKKS